MVSLFNRVQQKAKRAAAISLTTARKNPARRSERAEPAFSKVAKPAGKGY